MESSTRHRRRVARALIAGVSAALLLTGCGFGAQTLQPYTPAHGVSIDVTASESNRQLKVRNLLIVAGESGEGVVSASVVSPVADSLVDVSGTPLKADGTKGTPLSVTKAADVALKPDQLVVLTTPEPAVRVASPDLRPGLTADVTLTFASGRTAQAIVPVMSYDDAIYATVSPAPASTAAATAETETPAPTPTP
ncbi:MAG: hypothetical protein IPL36_02280 [Nigerium sp.]|nr:hypothetical protein [Nigerium sp.]